MNKMICRMALVLAVVSLAGCGLKGPLYFPKQEQPQKTASKVTPSKTASDAPVNAQQQSKTTDAEQQSAQ